MAFKTVLESHGAVLKAAAPKPRAAPPQQTVQLGVSQELRSRGGGGRGGGIAGDGGSAAVGIDMSGADQQAMQMYDYEEEVRMVWYSTACQHALNYICCISVCVLGGVRCSIVALLLFLFPVFFNDSLLLSFSSLFFTSYNNLQITNYKTKTTS